MSRQTKSRPPEARRSRAEAKAETRQALIEAGIEAFAEEGLDAPSLDSICARAGKTRGAFYVHFEDREALLVAAMDHVLGGFASTVLQSGANGDLAQSVQTFLKLAHSPRGLPGSRVPMHQFLSACARDERVRRRFQELLRLSIAQLAVLVSRGQEQGTLRDDVAAGSLAALLVAVVSGSYMLRDQGVSLALDAMTSDLLRLLAPPTSTDRSSPPRTKPAR